MKKWILSIVAVGVAGLGLASPQASSHREAPLISQDPLADNTDVYAFVSPNNPDRVTLIANFIPLEAPYGGPNFFKFDDNVLYEIKVDNDGDAVEDVTSSSRSARTSATRTRSSTTPGPITSLDSPNFNVRQFYTVTRIEGRGAAAAGPCSATICQRRRSTSASARRPTTRRSPPAAVRQLSNGIAGVRRSARRSVLRRSRTSSICWPCRRPTRQLGLARRVQRAHDRDRGARSPTLTANRHAAVVRRATRTRSSASGPLPAVRRSRRAAAGQEKHNANYVQVSRLGQPLVNEVVIPRGAKDVFNSLEPTGDARRAELRDRSGSAQAALRALRHPVAAGAAQRPRDDLPDRHSRTEPAGQREAVGDAAPERRHSRRRPTRIRLACSAATSPASRTAAGSATTSSTSRCARSPVRRRSRRRSTRGINAQLGDGVAGQRQDRSSRVFPVRRDAARRQQVTCAGNLELRTQNLEL